MCRNQQLVAMPATTEAPKEPADAVGCRRHETECRWQGEAEEKVVSSKGCERQVRAVPSNVSTDVSAGSEEDSGSTEDASSSAGCADESEESGSDSADECAHEEPPMRRERCAVSFSEDRNTVHEIQPYAEVYGMHPRTFVFGRHYKKLPIGRGGWVCPDDDDSDDESWLSCQDEDEMEAMVEEIVPQRDAAASTSSPPASAGPNTEASNKEASEALMKIIIGMP
mmetsp:Transcript_146923/g.471668  ORF Transcript_146923/g.471668 Transcript_146923/m.471668 type:complete len:225 (+) Transcript_146923:78-752(+)